MDSKLLQHIFLFSSTDVRKPNLMCRWTSFMDFWGLFIIIFTFFFMIHRNKLFIVSFKGFGTQEKGSSVIWYNGNTVIEVDWYFNGFGNVNIRLTFWCCYLEILVFTPPIKCFVFWYTKEAVNSCRNIIDITEFLYFLEWFCKHSLSIFSVILPKGIYFSLFREEYGWFVPKFEIHNLVRKTDLTEILKYFISKTTT